MADWIIAQVPGATIARTDEAGTAVPYHPVDRRNGDRNHGFFDLRENPDIIDQIPEAAESPGLRQILRAVNAPNSPLMSIGCAHAKFPQESPAPGEPACVISAYIDVTYCTAEKNTDPDAFIELSKDILRGVRPSTQHHIGFEFIIQPLKHFWGREGCFALMIKPFGHGMSEEAASSAFEYASHEVANSLSAAFDRRENQSP